MKAFIASGYSPQVAARLTLTDRAAVGRLSGSPHTAASLEELASSLPASLTDLQDAGANDPLDHLLARYGVEVVVVAVVLPLLGEIGDCWARADAGQPAPKVPARSGFRQCASRRSAARGSQGANAVFARGFDRMRKAAR